MKPNQKAYKSCRRNKFCLIGNCPLNCLYPGLPDDANACPLPQHTRVRLAKKDPRLRYHGLKLSEVVSQPAAGAQAQAGGV